MKETSKMHAIRRARGDFSTYFRGAGIDVGCGDDPLEPPAGPLNHLIHWDKDEGDATYLKGIPDRSLDFVYSSHCLEHLTDVAAAVANWARVLKPGGWLYVVVPDFALYEKCTFPSLFNSDHKNTFSRDIRRAVVGRETHFDGECIITLIALAGLHPRSIELEAYDYDFRVGPEVDQTADSNAVAQICFIGQKPTK